MRHIIDYLADLERKRRIAQALGGKKIFNSLEEEFLTFSSYLPETALTVKLPRMYELVGEEVQHFAASLKALGIECAIPQSIDFSGAFDYSSLSDAIIFLSPQQFEADHYSSERSYLNPLLEKAYGEKVQLISHFALNEALLGKVKCRRGNLDLKEVQLFPEEFIKGPYKLSVELDTPNHTVRKFIDFNKAIDELSHKPKESMLDKEAVLSITSSAVELRTVLGSLSRYPRISANKIEAETNSCIIRDNDALIFYLYEPSSNQNIAVYFGKNPFNAPQPKGLKVLQGEDPRHTLLQLVESGIFEPSANIVEQRIAVFEELYKAAIMNAQRPLNEEYPLIESFIESLKQANTFLRQILNPEISRKYTSNISPEIIEFMVYPTTSDPVVHELLPRLSWNKLIRNYCDTTGFISRFEKADKAERKQMLNEVVHNIIFSNYQNNNVNVWLYQNYKDFCSQSSIRFEVK